jgi:hypothetical protein
MRKKPLWERLKYKYQFMGQVEKEGEIYKKYRKVRRFPISQKVASFLVYLILVLALIAIANLLTNAFITTAAK